jgi:hypothetical protein
MREEPALALSMTRNRSENPTVKIAPIGFSQNESCS